MHSAVIMAGGLSKRMGEDKCLVKLQNKPMINWVIEGLIPVVDEIIISVSSDHSEPYNGFFDSLGSQLKSIRIVEDEITGIGPISGLLSSFKAAEGEYVAVAPCDAPFIKPELYTMLFSKAEGKDGAVPRINEYEPLHSVYKRKAMLSSIPKVLEDNNTSPLDAYRYMDLTIIQKEELKDYDPGLRSFMNINTREKLIEAEKLF